MTTVDLSAYPAPQVLETLDFDAILDEIKALFLAEFPTDELEAAQAGVPTRDKVELLFEIEGNLVTKILQAYAYHAMQFRARVNDVAKATMLTYAVDADLENLAAFYGVARKAGETDDALRARTVLAVDGISNAGPVAAYQFHALSADDEVKDVSVVSPSPGEVLVTILSTVGWGQASAALVATVNAALSAEDVRPLTDQVTVQSATVGGYVIDVRLWTYPGVDAGATVEAARSALQAYADSVHLIGYDVTISGITAAATQPGVQRVEVVSPTLRIVNGPSNASFCTAVNVTHGGTDV